MKFRHCLYHYRAHLISEVCPSASKGHSQLPVPGTRCASGPLPVRLVSESICHWLSALIAPSKRLYGCAAFRKGGDSVSKGAPPRLRIEGVPLTLVVLVGASISPSPVEKKIEWGNFFFFLERFVIVIAVVHLWLVDLRWILGFSLCFACTQCL